MSAVDVVQKRLERAAMRHDYRTPGCTQHRDWKWVMTADVPDPIAMDKQSVRADLARV